MNFKRTLVGTMALLMLSGCATKPAVEQKAERVTGIVIESVIEKYFDEGMIAKIKNNSPLGYFNPNSLMLSGSELGEYELETIGGNKLNTKDFAGKKVVYEFVAPWCGYCLEFSKEYAEAIEAANPDIQFVQVFGDGTQEEVAEFLAQADRKFEAENAVGIMYTEEVSKMAGDILLDSYPSFVFVDETGKISWTNSGMLTAEEFNRAKSIAFGEQKVYEALKEGVTLDMVSRNANDVMNDLTDEAIEKVDMLYGGDLQRTLSFYENIGKIVEPEYLYTIDEQSVSWDELKDKKIVYTFLPATFSGEYNNEENFEKLNEIASKNKDYVFVNILVAASEETPTEFYTKNEIVLPGYTVDATQLKTAEALYDIGVYELPTMAFVSEGGYIEGVTTGTINASIFDQAKEMFFGKTRISSMLRTEELTTEQVEIVEDQPVETAGTEGSPEPTEAASSEVESVK